MSAYREATQRPCGEGWPTPADAGTGETPALPVGPADFSRTLRPGLSEFPFPQL